MVYAYRASSSLVLFVYSPNDMQFAEGVSRSLSLLLCCHFLLYRPCVSRMHVHTFKGEPHYCCSGDTRPCWCLVNLQTFTPLTPHRIAARVAFVPHPIIAFKVAMVLNVDPRKANQTVRGTVQLPKGSGKSVRVGWLHVF